MKIHTLIVGAALAAAAGGAIAGEDSTERWHGVGPAFYEVEGGLQRFTAGEPEQPPSGGRSARCRFVRPASAAAARSASSG